MNNRGRKGFTLVEVLISLIIIGILSGVAMLLFGRGQAKAEATQVVRDMISIKKAAQMYYLDNESWFEIDDSETLGAFSIEILQPYLDRNLDEESFSGHRWNTAKKYRYFIYVNQPGTGNYAAKNGKYNVLIAANVTDKYVKFRVRKALEKMAPRVGLYDTDYTEHLDEDPEKYYFKATEDPADAGSTGGGIVLRVN